MSSAELQYNWLWCDDNEKVTAWFLNEPDHHEYQFFYSSFINVVNRAWELLRHKNAIIRPLDEEMINLLSQDPIPAEILIETLKKYNRLIGGTKGYLKGKGLIEFQDVAPELSAVKNGEIELRKKVRSFCKKQDKSEQKTMKDEDMVDVEAAPTEAASNNSERPVTFELAIVGGKKNDEDQDMA
ncbi:hypothetical protein KCV07_g8311, partial [Aureobasidium melanogenum]